VVGVSFQHLGAHAVIFFQFGGKQRHGGLPAVFMVAGNKHHQRLFAIRPAFGLRTGKESVGQQKA
jgi:hypothetical protein